MEWSDFHYSSPLENDYQFSPQLEVGKECWSVAENKVFENGLGEIDPTINSQAFFENVASKLPWKSMEEIRNHYEALVGDVEMIESGYFPIPDYRKQQEIMEKKKEKKTGSSSSSSNIHAINKTRTGQQQQQQRKRGVPWTDEEHQLFLMGLEKYGKGDWRSISRYYVISKTPTQVASHAQKYFRRQTSSTPMDRRRPSIHDIQTVNPTTIFTSSNSIAQRHGNYRGFINNNNIQEPSIPLINSCFQILPLLNHNFDGGRNQNSMLFPVNSSSSLASADLIMNQASNCTTSYPSTYMHA